MQSPRENPHFRLSGERLRAPDLLECEWLEVDGLGGYASSTAAFCPTRRYHGLLVARPEGSTKRHVFLAQFEERVSAGGTVQVLSQARTSDAAVPQGGGTLERFELVPYPRTVHRVGAAEVVREVQVLRGTRTVLCRWSLTNATEPITLELRPMFAFREADHLHFANDVLDPSVATVGSGFTFAPYTSLPPVQLALGGGKARFEPDPVWRRGLQYDADARRGYDCHEDLFGPGVWRLDLAPGEAVVVAATLDEMPEDLEGTWHERALSRVTSGPAGSAAADRLAYAADDFLYKDRGERWGVLAGFPWFGEWGRDSFIALPGLTLARGNLAGCERVLSGVLPFLEDGLVPNIFGATPADSHYGSVDAALWFARAVDLYARAGGDIGGDVEGDFRSALVQIAKTYASGTKLGIRADESGLVVVGSADLNPTWMDAQTSSGPVTPRDGCPVEIEALWYSLLDHLAELEPDGPWDDQRERVGASFLARFWAPKKGMLADVWKGGKRDMSVRPNMVIAAALERSPLSQAMRRAVVQRAREELLCPHGLRTLSPKHPDYKGVYAGGPEERDGAYHQGTAWPWLFGFYCEAHLRAFGEDGKEELRDHWEAFLPELDEYGLNHVSEVYDGDAPGHPGGSFAQAWNTAELLRARALLAEAWA